MSDALWADLGTMGELSDTLGGLETVRSWFVSALKKRSEVQARRARKNASRSRTLLELLDLQEQAGWSYWMPTHHPTSAGPDDIRGADIDALEAVLGADTAGEISGSASWADFADPAELFARNLVLIGSPESEPLTRLLLGYELRPDGRGTHYRGDTVPLVYRWHEELSSPLALCVHYRESGVHAVRPNWPLVWAIADKEGVEYPALSVEGDLLEDFLIVTVIPNFITARGWQRGAKIVSIAGLHGVGTRAALTLVRDDDVATELQRLVQELPARRTGFQAVIKVTSIDHDALTGSQPLRVHVHEVVPLTLSSEALETARTAATAALPAWHHQLDNRPTPARTLGADLSPPLTAEDRAVLDFVRRGRLIDGT